jgi:nicotinic acid phosphoribosyltransferase
MITPAVLISACGTMILSTSTRPGRVVDRVRSLSDRLEELAKVEAEIALLEDHIVEQHKPHYVHFRKHD